MITAYSITPRVCSGDLILPDAASCFDLGQTLDCGQAFRWLKQADGSYKGAAFGRLLHISSQGGDIVLHGVSLDDYDRCWRGYFDMERDYAALKESFADDPVLRDAMGYAPGIRVLRQEPWETVCTFIISANNNIPRIKGIVERLCLLLGDEIGEGFYSFPAPERLAGLGEDDLAPLRCGYRSGYLLDAARKAASGEVSFADVAELTTAEARKALLGIKGVGPKVADCALLFGFGRAECFPMDTWMKKVMEVLYPQGLPEQLLPNAGIAQQYLFHYARNHGSLFTKAVL